MPQDDESARVERLLQEARAAQDEARLIIEEARKAPLSAESLSKLREARAVLLRASARLDEAATQR